MRQGTLRLARLVGNIYARANAQVAEYIAQ